MPVNFRQLFDQYIQREDEKSAREHPLIKGRYSVGNISYIRCIHDVIRGRESPDFSIWSKKKMMRGKVLHPLIEEIYELSGHNIIRERDGKRKIEYQSSRVPGGTFVIVGQPDIIDDTDKTIVEVKTVDDDKFRDLVQPYEYHIAQASIYAYMHGYDKIRMLYISAGGLEDKQFDIFMDRNAVMRGIETADVLFYYDTYGKLPEEVPSYLISERCRVCMRDIQTGEIRCECGSK